MVIESLLVELQGWGCERLAPLGKYTCRVFDVRGLTWFSCRSALNQRVRSLKNGFLCWFNTSVYSLVVRLCGPRWCDLGVM